MNIIQKNSVKNQTNKKISKSKSSNNENNCKVFDNNDIFYTLRSIQYVYLIYSRYFLTCFLRSYLWRILKFVSNI